MPVLPFREITPTIMSNVFLAPDAWIIGDVAIADHVSIFFGVSVRGDIKPIRVGARTNLQEHALLHTSTGLADCIIGEDVTVGHRAILHGCTVSDRCIIGMGSTVLDGAVIGPDCIIGANSLVKMHDNIPSGSLALGSPARVVRALREDEIAQIKESARHYKQLGADYTRAIRLEN